MLLKAKITDGTVTVTTKWRKLVSSLEDEVAYKAMQGQAGSSAQDIFDNMLVNKYEDGDALYV